MTGRRSLFSKYIVAFSLWILFLGASTLILNLLVDPLWYSGGNRFFPQNYAFNERYSKTNLVLSLDKKFDCFIFGASRATLLNARKIKGHTCFNFAFSEGKVGEYLAFARYLKQWGANPRLLVVGVNEDNFFSNDDKAENLSIPDFVLTGQPPPSFWRSYLSIDVLDFSIRTLRRRSPLPRYYTDSFAAEVLPDAPTFQPNYDASIKRSARSLTSDRVMKLQQLRDIFPRSRMIGYVPPLNLWTVASMERAGELVELLRALHTASDIFDEFVDFAVPSEITSDSTLTYDGSHYYPYINDMVIERLFRDQSATSRIQFDSVRNPQASELQNNFGIDVKALPLVDYLAHYEEALRQFGGPAGIVPAKPD